jgi:beta-mannosidase
MINTWDISGFEPEVYRRDLLLSGYYDKLQWLRTQSAKDVHSILLDNNVIQHPYYKNHDLDCLWVEKKIWVYKSEFNITEEMLGDGNLELLFEGLDTYTAVILNGVVLAEFNNMFIEHRVDITQFAIVGDNQLYLEFDVVRKRAMEKELPIGFWTNYSTERAFARKAAYHFGWDWTSRIATVGLWKPVILNRFSRGKINSVHITTGSMDVSKQEAVLHFQIESTAWDNNQCAYRVEISFRDKIIQEVHSKEAEFFVKINNAKFWWTHDLGEPDLYQIKVIMLYDEGCIDSYACDYGIRTIQLSLSSEANAEHRFLFLLNGVPVMARGANWVPVSNFLSTAENERYIKLIRMAKHANMNMLNLWGGGIYEKDVFYETCDKEGILVWHYLMFACGEYPDYDKDFLDTVKEEIEKAVIRLRNYACIALWVGNVENTMLSEKISLPRKMFGDELFNNQIPEWLDKLDKTRAYFPTSPWSETGLANDCDSGDRHNWDVWFKDIPYSEYSLDTTRFASEYGLHAAPVKQTIETYIGAENTHLDNYFFQYLNKDSNPEHMYYYMTQYIGNPNNIDEYIDYSMFVQAEGLKYGTEHYRRNFPATSGALIWQLNDCMPVHSWSMIDYDLIPKASYYYSKRFFAPISFSFEEIDDTLTGLWVHNNSNTGLDDVIILKVNDFFGNNFYEEAIEIHIPPHQVIKVKETRVGGRYYPNVILPGRPRMFYLTAASQHHKLHNIRFFGNYKDISFPQANITAAYREGFIQIHTDCFARFVKIDGAVRGLELSDNYFDMEPGEVIDIKVVGEIDNLYVKALNSKAIPVTI